MKLPTKLEDHYVKKVLYNTSLESLPDEEWKPVENYENYMISNYGRLKSLERQSTSLFGKERMLPEKVMKLIFVKHFNRYLQDSMYHVHCTLSVEGNKYRKSVARLVYYHFVEKFDVKDRTIAIISKDSNSLHIHSNNLEKVSASERSLKIYRMNRARNRNVIYLQPVSQYTVEGKLVANFEDMYTAGEAVGVLPESIMDVVYKEFLTAGGFRWFLQSYHPKKKDFLITDTSDYSERVFNFSLWKKLGQPKIERNNPPACMNLSIKDLPNECWRLISGSESRFAISNKGRIKRLSSWVSHPQEERSF
ncbi:NUMOD4 domain-containing protein [Chryseobacterium sp. SIMBA_038]|uniref:NUMOD4 domain-containing protein n=1 Tax=Chryseobacterium sp. SIMBA_038 TaxID=3085780 RepID=UPI00397E11CC